MIFVDSSVWIAWFRGDPLPEADALDRLLPSGALVVGDLVLTEVLQGFDSDRQFNAARELMEIFPIVPVAGPAIALEAAMLLRALRRRGTTIRKTIDTLIAARCIHEGWALLTTDRDVAPFVDLGLRRAEIG